MKYLLDFTLLDSLPTGFGDAMLILKAIDEEKGGSALRAARPGQFVNIQVLQSHSTFLRRPISICDVDAERALLYLYVKDAGPATHFLTKAKPGEIFSLLLPLGHGFDYEQSAGPMLLVGGGVGIAPMLLLAKRLNELGHRPSILIGAATASRLILSDELAACGNLLVSTDDGSLGEKGFVSTHSGFKATQWSKVFCCGPLPMMKAIAAAARSRNIDCEVSLENSMACGLGACLCCVEDTTAGHRCVCTDGPVFNIKDLKW